MSTAKYTIGTGAIIFGLSIGLFFSLGFFVLLGMTMAMSIPFIFPKHICIRVMQFTIVSAIILNFVAHRAYRCEAVEISYPARIDALPTSIITHPIHNFLRTVTEPIFLSGYARGRESSEQVIRYVGTTSYRLYVEHARAYRDPTLKNMAYDTFLGIFSFRTFAVLYTFFPAGIHMGILMRGWGVKDWSFIII